MDLFQFVEFNSLEPRINNDETKCIVKLPVGVEPKLELTKQVALNHDAVMVELAKAEWTSKQ